MLTARHLTLRLSDLALVWDVSLQVRRGDVVGLIGPSGAGKTTVFNLLAGVVRPDRGSVYLDAVDVTHMAIFERARRGITYLSQEPSIFKTLTVEQNLLIVLEAWEADRRRARIMIDHILTAFDLDRLRSKLGGSLSGGERRRCEIARAIVSSPRYLLLDEPFAGVDPIGLGDVRALIDQIARSGVGVLITDHNVRETLRVVDRAYIIEAGSILAHGSPQQLVRNPLVQAAYLGADFRV